MGLHLPDYLLELLNGDHLLEKQHEAFMLLTINENMWPHTAMISVGEIVAPSSTELRLSLWQNTATTTNIIRTGKATVVMIVSGVACYIELSLRKMSVLHDTSYPRERFIAELISIREDVAKYADITSGVQIQLHQPEEVIERWNETIQEMLLDRY